MSDGATDYRAWLEKADEDRLCVANELKADRKPWSVICFCAQQAAEKHLKTFLAFHGAQPKKIHDLRVLLRDCGAFDASLVELEKAWGGLRLLPRIAFVRRSASVCL